MRLWLAADHARPLPEVFAQRYGSVTIGDRGGIIVRGTDAANRVITLLGQGITLARGAFPGGSASNVTSAMAMVGERQLTLMTMPRGCSSRA